MGLFSLACLTLFSTLNIALRTPSRARMAEQFERLDVPNAFERFVLLRSKYLLATATLRSATVLLLFVAVLVLVGLEDSQARLRHILISCTAAWGLLLVFGVAIPYGWAKYAGEWLVVLCLPLLDTTRWICWPIITLLELFDPVIRRLAGAPARSPGSFADEMEQEILTVVSEGEIHGAVDEQEKEMIESVIELGDLRVAEIMTPRTEIIALPADASPEQVLRTIREKGPSRIPVYEETIDRIAGVLYVKDLLRRSEGDPFELRGILRKALFIPESKPVRDLLREFQREKLQIAIVLDEYGGTAGLVTPEDIFEVLVGDLADEYETPEPAAFRKIDERTYEVDAAMRVDDLNDQLDLALPGHRDYETIGGFVFSALGRIPKVGERLDHENFGIQVLAAEPRRVRRLLLTVAPRDIQASDSP